MSLLNSTSLAQTCMIIEVTTRDVNLNACNRGVENELEPENSFHT